MACRRIQSTNGTLQSLLAQRPKAISLPCFNRQVEYPLEKLGTVKEEKDSRVIYTNVLEGATVGDNVTQFEIVLEIDEGLVAAGTLEHPQHRKLFFKRAFVRIWNAVKNAFLSLRVTVTLPGGAELTYDGSLRTDSKGEGRIRVTFDKAALNKALNGLSKGCKIKVEDKQCTGNNRCFSDIKGQVSIPQTVISACNFHDILPYESVGVCNLDRTT